MMRNSESEEVNTLGCCFYWTFRPGAVVTATPSPEIYFGLPSRPNCKSQAVLHRGATGNCSLHSFTLILHPSCFCFSFLFPYCFARCGLSCCCRLKQIVWCCTRDHGTPCPRQRPGETSTRPNLHDLPLICMTHKLTVANTTP